MWLIPLLILTTPIWLGLIAAFYWGLRALRHKPEHLSTKASLRWIALNLCEPLVNFILIGVIAYANIQVPVWGAVLRTLPMMVLLLPAIDLAAAHPLQRRIATQALKYGGARWLVTIAIHVAASGVPSFEALIILLIGGTFLLWASFLWGQGLLEEIFQNESYVMQEARASA